VIRHSFSLCQAANHRLSSAPYNLTNTDLRILIA
jgi:hypothetical protein